MRASYVYCKSQYVWQVVQRVKLLTAARHRFTFALFIILFFGQELFFWVLSELQGNLLLVFVFWAFRPVRMPFDSSACVCFVYMVCGVCVGRRIAQVP